MWRETPRATTRRESYDTGFLEGGRVYPVAGVSVCGVSRLFFMKRLILVLAAAIALGQTAIASAGGVSHPALRNAIQPYAPRVTSVKCASMSGYGYTFPSTGEIWLNQYLCNPLDALEAGIVLRPKRQGAGLLTLVHEAIHNKANVSEARTECLAFQDVDDVLRSWFPPGAAPLNVLSYAYLDHLRFVRYRPLYRSQKCREDGPWDSTPGDGIWP